MADYEATPELISKLNRGHTLQIKAISLAANEITPALPLSDTSGNSFRKANDGPLMDPKVFEEQQKKTQEDLQKRGEPQRNLQADLQKRADGLRKKFEQQQGAAGAK
jgi:hypothetical protein